MRCSTGYCSLKNRPNVSANIWRSSVRLKSISKLQHGFCHDVALDLIGPTKNRGFAIVEIPRRIVLGVSWAKHQIALSDMSRERCCRWTQGPPRKVFEFLIDHCAFDFQQRGFRPRRALFLCFEQHPQIGDFHRLKINLRLRYPCRKQRIFNQWLAPTHRLAGNRFHFCQRLHREAHARNAGPFMRQQEFCDGPAFVFLPNEVANRHPHIGEKHLIHLMPAFDQFDRAHLNPRRRHIHKDKADTSLLLYIGISSTQAENPIRMLPQGGPGLLTIDDPRIAITLGLGLE
mmetsp:Transcript_7523/g.12891  ORF Transcript_7523/g.12891 Transcript_7523/m.12891 type:complete len:288 (-) Transcript_7523:1937-2800(-)